METRSYADASPIAAIATPLAAGALAIVRASGPDCLALLRSAFSRPRALDEAGSGTAVHGWILDPLEPGKKIDEVVVLVWRPPHGYTGEEAFEIICHGAPAAALAVMGALERAGFLPALPGEFSLRAFMNGKTDLARSEAVAELVAARTDGARALAVERLSGRLSARVGEARSALVAALAAIEIQLDYAEDDDVPGDGLPRAGLHEALADIKSLAATWSSGRLMGEGARVALAGRTNAGKSSLFNLFLKEDRAIVSDVHGTTRDYLEAWIDLGGLPVRLYDTAGLRESPDPLEREGQERSLRVVESADAVIYLVDAASGLSADDEEFLRSPGLAEKTIRAWSRCDLSPGAAPPSFFAVSVVSGQGFRELEAALRESLLKDPPRPDGLQIASARQKALLESAADALTLCLDEDENGAPLDAIVPYVSEAIAALGEITGETATPDILSEIFGRFCVGK